MRAHRLLILACVILGPFGFLRGEETLVYEGHFLLKMHGQVSGRMHFKTVRIREAGKPEVFVSTHVQKNQIKRGRDVSSSEESGRFVESADGKPLEFAEITRQSKEEVSRKGVVAPGVVTMSVETPGGSQEVRIPYEGTFLFPQAETTLRKDKGFAPGTTYSYSLLLVGLGQVRKVDVRVLEPETLTLDGKDRAWHKLEMTGIVPGVTIHLWCGDDGNWRRFKMDVNELEMVACSQEEWAKPIEAPEIDAMAKNSVDPGFLLPAPARLDEVVYKLSLSKGDLSAVAWEDPRQEVVRRSDGALTLRVKRLEFNEQTAPALPIQAGKDLAEYLQSTPMLQCADAAIVQTAKDCAAGETNAWKVAKKLERYVYENITAKSYDTGFASAAEVQKNREGDCTEHAVWLAALLRAQGIPSKVSMGLSMAQGTFNYHMWTEAWLGRWVALDATLGGPSVDPAHIELADSPLDGAGMGEKFLGVMQVFGRMNMEIESAVVAGKPYTGEELKQPGKIENGRYLDAALGIAFPVPAGFELLARGAPLPNGKELPRMAMGVLVHRAKGVQIVMVNVATPPGADLPTVLKQPKLKTKPVPGGEVHAGQHGATRFLIALAPGSMFRFEAMARDPAAAGDALGEIVNGLRLDGKTGNSE